jgi:hypothetical protein
MSVQLNLGGDDALHLMVAIDTALTALAMRTLLDPIHAKEIEHAESMLRCHRLDLLQARARAIEAAINRSRK